MPSTSGAQALGKIDRTSERSLPGSEIDRHTMALMTFTTPNRTLRTFARCEQPVALECAPRHLQGQKASDPAAGGHGDLIHTQGREFALVHDAETLDWRSTLRPDTSS